MPWILFQDLEFAALEEAFASLGVEVRHNLQGAALTAALQAEAPLLCMASMYKLVRQPLAARSLRRRLNQRQVPLTCWNRDGPSHMGAKAWRLALLRTGWLMDIAATHTLQDSGFARDVIFLPNAAWHTRYHLGDRALTELRNSARYRVDVSFFGPLDGQRFPEMQRRGEFFAALQPRLQALGVTTQFTGATLDLPAQIELIQSSRINLNFHAGADARWQGGWRGQPPSWGLPERCYGIPAAGGFLLSDRRGHAADDFVPGREWADFDGLDDCVAKIQYFLAHFDQSRTIAEAAHARVVAQHTYVHRAQRLIEVAADWRERRKFL